MRIAYYLMTHKNSRQIERLVERLSSSDASLVLIHHDAKYPQLTISATDSVSLIQDRVHVQWGRISVVQAMWKGIEWLQNTHIPYDWLIFLSGQDYPIKPLSIIELELNTSNNIAAYVHHEPIPEYPLHAERYYQALCRRRYFFRRVKIPGIPPIYVKRAHPYRDTFTCFAGSQWINLSRAAVESLWSRRTVATNLMEYLAKASCPDETFFQTLLINDSHLVIRNTDRRFIIWRDDADNPDLLTLDHLGAMQSSDAWFARKVDDTRCPELLDSLDYLVSSP